MKNFTFLALFIAALGFGSGLMAQSGAGKVDGGGVTHGSTTGPSGTMASDDAGSGGNNSHLLLEDDGRIYPNPATDGKFNIDLPTPSETIEVFNTLGQLVQPVFNFRNAGRTIQVDLGGYTPGIYFVRITINGRTVIKRVLVR